MDRDIPSLCPLTPSFSSMDPFALLLASLHTFVWQDQKPSHQREKNVVYIVGTLPGEGRSGSSAHPLASLQDLLAFLVGVLGLGFPSLTKKIVFFFLHSSHLSDQWDLLRVPCLKL